MTIEPGFSPLDFFRSLQSVNFDPSNTDVLAGYCGALGEEESSLR